MSRFPPFNRHSYGNNNFSNYSGRASNPPWSQVPPRSPVLPLFNYRQPPPTFSANNSQEFSQYCPSDVSTNRQIHPPLDHRLIDNKSQDQAFVDEWLSSRRCPQRDGQLLENTVKINETRCKLNLAISLIKDLENGAKTLKVMAKTVSSVEWEEKCKEVEEKKVELNNILLHLRLRPEQVKCLNDKLVKRSKKRARLKRLKEKRKQFKEDQKVLTQNSHRKIDNWQKDVLENINKIKREEELQKEADAVLWGVTQKKIEVRRQISVLSALLELRQVRVKQLTAAGQTVSQSQTDSFNTIIEMLKNSWTDRLKECSLEEHALRGMLTKADIEDDPVKRFKKLVLQEWESAIFGSCGPISTLNTEQLLETRKMWDSFVVGDDKLVATKIPPGWVLPVAPSSDQWHKLLKY